MWLWTRSTKKTIPERLAIVEKKQDKLEARLEMLAVEVETIRRDNGETE